LKPGTLLQPVVKAQGIPKGGKVQKIGVPIRVLTVRREPLEMMGWRYSHDPIAEGFPQMTNAEFIAMFCEHNDCSPDTEVTRISFEYTEAQS
jgi:hypothetical protein